MPYPESKPVHAVGMAVIVVDNREPDAASFSYFAAGMAQPTSEAVSAHGTFTVRLPPGHYSFSVYVPTSQLRELGLQIDADTEYRFVIDPTYYR
jgi:hypothetical protein